MDTLQALGTGKVAMKINLPDGREMMCTLSDVLYLSKFSFNFLSVSKATKSGKFTKFSEN